MAATCRFGDGVFGPFEDGADEADVNDEWESPIELAEDARELTRGDDAPEEYANGGWVSGIDGNLSLAYEGR